MRKHGTDKGAGMDERRAWTGGRGVSRRGLRGGANCSSVGGGVGGHLGFCRAGKGLV